MDRERAEAITELAALHAAVDRLLAERRYDDIAPLLKGQEELAENDNAAVITYYMCLIHAKEKESGEETILTKIGTMDELVERFTRLKFLLRRLDYGVSDDGTASLKRFLERQRVSLCELATMLEYCVLDKDKVWEEIRRAL